jgi:hypothetical protein
MNKLLCGIECSITGRNKCDCKLCVMRAIPLRHICTTNLVQPIRRKMTYLTFRIHSICGVPTISKNICMYLSSIIALPEDYVRMQNTISVSHLKVSWIWMSFLRWECYVLKRVLPQNVNEILVGSNRCDGVNASFSWSTVVSVCFLNATKPLHQRVTQFNNNQSSCQSYHWTD